jgi:hypothetical protein
MTNRSKAILGCIVVVLAVAVWSTRYRRVQELQELPPAEMAKVAAGNARVLYQTLFQGDLYNGSSFSLRELIITITARENSSGKTRWSRQFKDNVFIEPLTTGDFQIAITGAEGARLSWTIDSLKGEPRGY